MNRGGEINPDFRSWFHTSHTALELRSGYPLFGYSYSLSKLEVNALIHEKKYIYFLNYKELNTTWTNSTIAIIYMDPKFLFIQ
jgi:hypothetical protein